MKFRILIPLLLLSFEGRISYAQPVQSADSLLAEVKVITSNAMQELQDWRDVLNGDNVSSKEESWKRLNNLLWGYRFRLAVIEEPEGDPGYVDAARNLVKFLYYECDNRLLAVQRFAEGGSRNDSEVKKHQSLYGDVFSSARDKHSVLLFYQAWLVARATVKSPQAFCASVSPMPEIIQNGFPGYKGELLRQINENTAEYRAAKLFPGAKSGVFREQRGVPTVTYVMYENSDSATVRKQFQSTIFQVLACELPGIKGYFYDYDRIENGYTLIQSCYMFFPGSDNVIRVNLRKSEAGKYDAVLVFGKRGG
ncbi:MAG: hypothetical protein R3D00_23975 [Bacteroidia bacterium]